LSKISLSKNAIFKIGFPEAWLKSENLIAFYVLFIEQETSTVYIKFYKYDPVISWSGPKAMNPEMIVEPSFYEFKSMWMSSNCLYSAL
jgi:hypothetical protein